MEKQRDSGLEIIGPIDWGTHFCQLYKTKQDLLDILIPYFKAGLENNEFCVWVTSEFLTTDDVLKALKEGVPGFFKYHKKGQIEIFHYNEWYLKAGKFEMKRVLKMWVDKHDHGLAAGFDGMRVSGNPFWIDNKKDWDDFASYEAQINKVISPFKLLVLCTYSLEKCKSNEVIDVITNHQITLIKRDNKWETMESAEGKRVRQEIAHLASFPELNINPIAEISMRGELLYANRAMLKLFPDIREKGISHIMLSGIELKKIRLLIREVEADGRWYRQAVAYVSEAGSIRVYCNDITERKELEQLKDEFLGVATHELKTPVTSIKAYVQVLHKIFSDKGDVSAADLVLKMENQINKLIGLITDLLDITKIQTGKLKFNNRHFDFNEMVDEVVEEVQRMSHTHKIIKKLSKTQTIFGDRERLGQVITNFLINAVKYSPESNKIVVGTKINEKKIKLFVQDFGDGIPRAKQKRVFERFYRVRETGERTPAGLGLGLYISSEIIKRHQGEIGVTSQTSKGSTFYFLLNL